MIDCPQRAIFHFISLNFYMNFYSKYIGALMSKSSRLHKSEHARTRRHAAKKIVEDRTENYYQKLRKEKVKKKKHNLH